MLQGEGGKLGSVCAALHMFWIFFFGDIMGKFSQNEKRKKVLLALITACHFFILIFFFSSAALTVQLVVDHVLQPLQPLENGLPVHQVGNFAIPGAQPLVRNTADLDELLGAVLDPAVHREQDNAHEHQDVDGQQSFDFACHSHVKDRYCPADSESSPAAAARARWPALPPY